MGVEIEKWKSNKLLYKFFARDLEGGMTFQLAPARMGTPMTVAVVKLRKHFWKLRLRPVGRDVDVETCKTLVLVPEAH